MRPTAIRLRRTIIATVLLSFFLSTYSQPVISYESMISTGLSAPLEIVNAGDNSGRLFIVQKGGTILIWNGTSLLATPFLNISSLVSNGSEQGLLSLAFHPNYEANDSFYVYYTNTGGEIVVAAYTVSANPNVANPTGTVLVTIDKPAANHNGGHLQFRTDAGTGIHWLYFATGDGGDANDPENDAQTLSSDLGKMLRINVHLTPPIDPEVWAIGLRNPFRWSFDRLNFDMWIGDVGQGSWEEVDYRAGGTSGANYGWRCYEGLVPNPNIMACDPQPDQDEPVFVYPNPMPGSSAVTGGYVYRGSDFPAMYGWYIATDFYSGTVYIIAPDGAGGWTTDTQTGGEQFIAGYGEDEDGELYAASLLGNEIFRVTTSTVLPVTLTEFFARRNNNITELTWRTTTEENTRQFVIEYGFDGRTFQQTATIAATNNPNGSFYAYDHSLVASSKIYYRLRIEDLDGKIRFSPVITVGGQVKGGIKIFPTIIRSGQLTLTSEQPVKRISIFSLEGQEMFSRTSNGAQGYITLDLPPLAKGMYLVRVSGNEWSETQKIVIQ